MLVNKNKLNLFAILICYILRATKPIDASLAMKRLYEDLFTEYNRLILPVANNKTKVTVTLGLKLGQILDLNLKQQILSTNVWVEQSWHDHRLIWMPELYGGIDMIHVPAENIWIPDIVLFNNADGNYELTLVAKAVLYANGTVVWKPPTMFRSTCEIDVEYFPFDIQTCFLRFGSWTYAGDEVEIKHIGNKKKVDIGIDLSQFYKNVEWDIIDVPAYYNEVYYDCCTEPFPDVTFKIVIRRKMLFYLVNLILPVALMTFMTVSVFYLPSDSNEKVTLSISILTSLIVFFLLMLEIIPPTSLAVPLFGKYLLFTLVLVSLSACVSVYVLNIHHRSPSVHLMSPRMRQLFLKTLPRLLRLDRPDPRERSSLNRFRKKKIAQQMLQAHQHNKVYDLAQPLAASLNLIETLHKSYDFNPRDDQATSTKENDDDEGRYFRRYIDNYIRNMKRTNQENQQTNKQNTTSQTTGCNCDTRRTISCCEHNKCCTRANQPLNQLRHQNFLPPSCHHYNQRQRGKLANSCCGATLDWTEASRGAVQNHSIGAPNCSNQQTTCKVTCTGHHESHFGILNDDTLDMTFDYDEQENTNNNVCGTVGGFLAPPVPPDRETLGKMAAGTTGPMQPSAEDDLPSPPPPPRQLAHLGDSMKELSGRLSSCSQQKLGSSSTAIPNAHSVSVDDEDSNEAKLMDHGQLVDKLINSINLINNASDEMDTTTTTSNTDEDYRHLKVMANQLNGDCHEPRMAPLAFEGNFYDINQQQRESNKCICNSSCPTQNHNHIQQHHCYHQQQQQQPTQKQCQSSPAANQENSQQDRGVLMRDSLPGINHGRHQPSELLLSLRLPYDQMPAHVRAAIRSILFIADTIKNEDDENSAIEDWESMSMVVDRLFLWIFFLLCTFGSLIILALAPSLYDQRDSIDDKLRIDIPPSNCSVLLPADG